MPFISVLTILFALIRLNHPLTYLCDPNSPCGCSTQPAVVTKIVGGENAMDQSWGWMVSLLLNDSSLCGGTILSSSWVLTAAHCVDGLSPGQVIISAATNRLFGGKQVSYASQIIVHSGYNRTRQVNDIALIRVLPTFNMSDANIGRICLPSVPTIGYPPTDSSVRFHWNSHQ